MYSNTCVITYREKTLVVRDVEIFLLESIHFYSVFREICILQEKILNTFFDGTSILFLLFNIHMNTVYIPCLN